VIRFPLRRIGAVLVLKDRDGDGWLALCGSNGWLFGWRAEACREARWLARNTGLPVRELIGGAT
jgi:hypothetical protein